MPKGCPNCATSNDDTAHFCRAFRAKFGVSASEFRANQRRAQAAKTTLFAAGKRALSEKSAAGDFFPIT